MKTNEDRTVAVAGGPEVRRRTLEERRIFLKRALAASVYAAPVIMSFSSRDLVKATSTRGGSPNGSPNGSPA